MSLPPHRSVDRRLRTVWRALWLPLVFSPVQLHAAATMTRILHTRTLRCGINSERPEYSNTDDHGPRQAFEADFCRAVAVAILGPSGRTVLTTYPDDVAAMAALRSGKVDLLPSLTLDMTHATQAGITFSSPILYDGVGFMVPIASAITAPAQLSGRKICFLAETQVELSLRAWFTKAHLDLLPYPFQEEGEMEAAFVSGNCAALSGDRTRLAWIHAGFGRSALRYALLPDQISDDPLAAASPSADTAFAAIVEWTLEVLLNAEAIGVHQSTAVRLSSRSGDKKVDATTTDSISDPALDILTGRTLQIGVRLGLDNAWALRVIAAVGSYGEMYERDLGYQSALKIPRDRNRLARDGGLMLPLPLK
jgi:general L-amino acid transport system substrate-binding protein